MSGEKGARASVNGDASNACYFCNEQFELGQLQIHLKQCGSILEQCPLRCGAWIQRRHRDTHVRECPRVRRRGDLGEGLQGTHAPAPDPASPPPPPVPPAHTWTPNAVPINDCVSYLEKEVAAIRLSMSEDTHQKSTRVGEMDVFRNRLSLVDERLEHVVESLNELRAAVDEQARRASDYAAQLKRDTDSVQLALQELQGQQMSTALRLETTVNALASERSERELLETALEHQDSRLRTVDKLASVVEYVRAAVEEERAKSAHSRAVLEAEVDEARRSSRQLAQLAALRQDLQAQAIAEQPALDRLAVVEVSSATVRAEVADMGARVEALARDLRALSKSYLKLRTELVDFQSKVSFDGAELGGDNGERDYTRTTHPPEVLRCIYVCYVDIPTGHLIWRIDNFAARMKEARENDVVLSSPIFRTSKYGYTLKLTKQFTCRLCAAAVSLLLGRIGRWSGREIACPALSLARSAQAERDNESYFFAELHLNGIGKWRGRHLTCTVRLLGGRYDALLHWPCDLSVNIILKDQPGDRNQAMDIIKNLQLRRKSSSKRHDYDSGDTSETTRSNEALDKTIIQLKRQYIFIPHTSLDKFEYVKNDVIFLEFIVNQ
ncbi:TNF receptor-associated factor 5 [Eumeta japonica]|uniref:TNF receptor-associated factor 5 n=1 Tax=Eumeta variegata TaxID=151549 RepID=A0A4C1VXC4_EUMVA|nr:TNF receptor-associated factor 5 [Eumeta japonica]